MYDSMQNETHNLGVLLLLGSIRSQHSFRLVDRHTSSLDHLEVLQPRDNLTLDPIRLS
jgi:hypothetical protein